MSEATQIAVIAGIFALIGSSLTLIATILASHLEAKRRFSREDESREFEERAILHGIFALTNFLNDRLNEWAQGENILRLSKLKTAQTYHAKLIEKAPSGSDKLMISLVDLGLRIDAILFLYDELRDNKNNSLLVRKDEVQAAVAELGRALATVDTLLEDGLSIIEIEEVDRSISGEHSIATTTDEVAKGQ